MIYKLSLKDKPNTLLIITASFSRLNDVPIQRAGSLGTLITNIWKQTILQGQVHTSAKAGIEILLTEKRLFPRRPHCFKDPPIFGNGLNFILLKGKRNFTPGTNVII